MVSFAFFLKNTLEKTFYLLSTNCNSFSSVHCRIFETVPLANKPENESLIYLNSIRQINL